MFEFEDKFGFDSRGLLFEAGILEDGYEVTSRALRALAIALTFFLPSC